MEAHPRDDQQMTMHERNVGQMNVGSKNEPQKSVDQRSVSLMVVHCACDYALSRVARSLSPPRLDS